MLLTGAWVLQLPKSGRIPNLPVPPPIPANALKALSGTAQLTLRNVSFTTSVGARVEIPLLEITPQLPTMNGAPNEVRVEAIRLVGLRVVAPIDRVHTGIDLFMKIPGPRLIVDRVSIVDADVGELADPAFGVGRWFYRYRDVDVELRDIDIGGNRTSPDVIRLTRLDLVGESKGVPAQITRAAGTVVRTSGTFDVRLAAGFGLTEINAHTTFARAGGWRVDLVADTVRFSELRAFVSRMPREGTGKISLSAAKAAGAVSVDFRLANAQFGASRLALRGQLATGSGGRADGLVLTVTNLQPEDMKRAFDVDVPGDGPYNGRITASGVLREGLRVNGALAGSAAGVPSRIALNGSVRGHPNPVLDLEIAGDPIRLADTAFNARVVARGPLDKVAIKGGIQLRPGGGPMVAARNGAQPAPMERVRSAAAEIDLELIDPDGAAPRRLSGKALLRPNALTDDDGTAPVHAVAEGAIVFAKEPTVSARITIDSLPLVVLPWPTAIEDVSGFVRGDFRMQGALAHPDVQGDLNVHNGSMVVRSARLAITDINGPIHLRDDRLLVENLTGRVREGTLRVAGEALVFGKDKRVDLTVRGARVGLTQGSPSSQNLRVPRYVANLEVRVVGPVDGARANGKVDIIDGATNRLSGTATGSAILAKNGALEVDIAADSLPLETLPLPSDQVDEVSGHVRGRIAIRGTLNDPQLNGAARLVDAGGRVRRSGTRLSGLGGELRIDDGVVTTDIRGVAGTGALALTGTANLMGERTVDLRFRADSATLTNTDSAHVIASARVAITGPMKQPQVDGRVRLVGGWVKEDVMLKSTVIDPEKPPFAELAARVPWVTNSRLLRNVKKGEPKKGPPFRGTITIEVSPDISMVDEDSKLYGTGEVLVSADSSGVHALGGVKFLGGFYANYGERFIVQGGGFRLSNTGATLLAMRSDNDRDKLGARNYGSGSPLDWYPGLEIFAHGTTATAEEQARRLSKLPESQTELAALLIYGSTPEPIAGLGTRRFWLPDEPSDLIGERAESQGGPLLWSYIADELYDYLPLTRTGLQGGTVTIGSRFPGRLVQGPLFRLNATVADDLQLFGSWASEGSALPGVRARLRRGEFSLVAFSEPKFFAASPAGEAQPGYFHRRRTGIGLRFDRDR